MTQTARIMLDDRWSWIAPLLACPSCRGPFESADGPPDASGLRCAACATAYASRPGGSTLDLRCKTPRRHTMTMTTGALDPAGSLAAIPHAPPDLPPAGVLPDRAAPHILPLLRQRVPPQSIVVEIGGGTGAYRDVFRGTEYRFVTTDYGYEAADILADAHALPFRDDVASAVVMQSVIQSLENPFAGMSEAARILRKDGLLLGTADCGAVFAGSYFNPTPWGTIALLASAGLAIERMWVTKDVLSFAGTNPGYPAAIKLLLRLLSRIARWRVWTPRLLLAGRRRDEFVTAGSCAFVARKATSPAATNGGGS